MKKSKLKKEIINLQERNESLLIELKEIRHKEVQKKISKIIEIAQSLDTGATLVENYCSSDFGIYTEVTLTFNFNVDRIKF